MGTNEDTLAALDTDLLIPDRDFAADVALLPLGCRRGIGSIDRQGTYRQVVAQPCHHHGGDGAYKFRRLVRDDWWSLEGTASFFRNLHFMEMGQGCINGRIILLDHCFATFFRRSS